MNGTARHNVAEDSPHLAITTLSNLLSANLDVGLKHCLTLGYHEDPILRTAFMRLLTSILQQGARFHGLSTKRLSTSPKVSTDLLVNDPENLALAVAICDVCPPGEVDEMSTLLFRVFEAKGMLLSLVKILTEREVAMTSEHNIARGPRDVTDGRPRVRIVQGELDHHADLDYLCQDIRLVCCSPLYLTQKKGH
jgi:neurofibromin 1